MNHEEAASVETEAPRTDEAGVAMDGDYPANHRLRAEALAADNKVEDPDNIVSPELIADAADRVEAEEKARKDAETDAARNTPSTKWTVDRLTAEAAKRNVALTDGMDKAAILAAIEAAPAPSNKEA